MKKPVTAPAGIQSARSRASFPLPDPRRKFQAVICPDPRRLAKEARVDAVAPTRAPSARNSLAAFAVGVPIRSRRRKQKARRRRFLPRPAPPPFTRRARAIKLLCPAAL
ncbi:hypothetical protein M0R45_009451 [Rubus argutus]|uniref:Uncharacterized protein n=1 Tax=Rubus argutus TaxID=59490 RepID=A0AAW1Y7G2_RUBAR